jgi:hypothetical protein
VPRTAALLDERAAGDLIEHRFSRLEHQLVGGRPVESLGHVEQIGVAITELLPAGQGLLSVPRGLLGFALLEHRRLSSPRDVDQRYSGAGARRL